ncbi:N,N'-diacetylbacillosaminyl-diphospho-undecaprenol alpha-1,3-N-acetylgalactosaminyltransferase [mine drainage metagenome]|uniref:N, N'-diacetylbacillosaminyl-diphospho-undecaprenol alpha-1,3-N-acetylgalactosaminyltransferase n=1 Tax=mine drainage metagenome TaxID=410659 RepID=A0A1J5SEN8_9ZZZZ
MPKLLFLVTEDWYFCSHRLPVARAAKAAGYEVVVATRVSAHADAITAEGFKLIAIGLRRSSRNPWRELGAILEIAGIYRRERPDLVHHVALKPALYGAIAARLARVPAVVNALAGLGFVFASASRKARLLRPWVVGALRLSIDAKGSALIVQNPDDRKMLVEAGVVRAARVRLIRGSGVDIRRFALSPEPAGTPLVMLPSRLLWDKGVGEFVAAAKLLRERGVAARFALVGDSDPETAAAIPVGQLQAWQSGGAVEWWGRREDMPAVLASSHVVCLPSYRGEGLPKVLLEAAACGRPLVATDVPGCREIVIDGGNGLLVPPRDAPALAEAIGRLLADPGLRAAMGRRGRELVETEFSEERVVAQTLALYRELAGQ